MLFQLFDAGADIRLHAVQFHRRLGNASLDRDRSKYL